jgi:uncharacterized cupredoxin-like copper-binding protein
MSKLLRAALAIMLLLTFVACGDDSGDGQGEDQQASEQPTEEPSNEEFCTAVVDAETALLATLSGGEAADLESLLVTVEETAPEEISTEVDAVVAATRKGMKTQSDEPFGTDEFHENEEAVDQWVTDNCGFEEIDVAAVEYAFEGVPETVAAGNTTFNFTNEGEEVHEMLMIRFKDANTSVEDLIQLSDKEAQKKIEFLGASYGPPGYSDSEIKTMTPGKYALVCFVSVGTTSEDKQGQGPPHITRGMSAEFTVE